jgi:hypothetical protein
MNSRERVTAVMNGEIPDRMPIGEYAIDCDTVEKVIGHETFLRAKAKSQIAFWEGRREEVAQSWREDFVELHKRLPIFDIANLAAQASTMLPPAGAERTRYKKLNDVTYELENGDIYRYSEATRDLTLVKYGHAPHASIEQYTVEPTAAAPDPSCLEVYDALIPLFPEKFVIGFSGPEVGLVELGTTEETLLCYALEPELALAAERFQLAVANALDRYYVRPGIQAVLWGQDHAYVNGPMISPAMFRTLALPVYESRVRSVKSVMGLFVFKHACGNNWRLMDMYVEAGFDTYQSIQASAGMDLARVKEAYGRKLVLWGGMPLELLQSGTAAECRTAVRKAAEAGKPGGRYIFGSSHSIAVGTRYENFMAMLDEYERVAAYEGVSCSV